MSVAGRECVVLFVAGVFGVVLLVPYQLALFESLGLDAPAPLPLLLLAGLLQSTILVAIAVAAGLWFARRVGLGAAILEAALRGEPVGRRLRAMLPLPVILGIAVAAALLLVEALVFQPRLPPQLTGASSQPPAWTGLLASFYGGVTEELLTRLFLVSLVAWLLSRILRGPAVFWIAILSSALLFGLGHLPATAALVPLTPLIVARAIALNGLAGIVFGWLYWRSGLEAAMVAHFSADAVLHVVAPALPS